MTVRLRYSRQPLAGRAELERYARAGAAQPPGQIGAPQVLRQALGPNAKQAWRLTTTARAMGLDSFGVYPLSVEVNDTAGRVLAAQHTFLTFVPNNYRKILKPTKIAWVMPLVDQPHRVIGSSFRDDRLAADFAQGGRLNKLVAAARATKTPLTWSIDPALLDDARTMTKPYTVRGAQKPKSAAADRWLADLKAAAAGDPYFALPYADSDVVALVRNHRLGDLKLAYKNNQAAQATLGRSPEPIAMPPEGVADQPTLNQLSKDGSQIVLLSSDVLPGTAGLTYTPTAAIAVQNGRGTKYAVAADRTIASVIGADTRQPGAAVLAEQRFLAETAMITAERPSLQRTVVIVPPRRWNPGQELVERLMTDSGTARWLQPISLRQAAQGASAQRTFAGYPAAYRSHELNARYLRSVRSLGTKAYRFSSVFEPPLTGYPEAILRLESSAWRGKRAAARAGAARSALADQLARDRRAVDFVLNSGPGPSLAGEIGQVPVTIANDMAGHSITVQLEVTSTYPARLQIGELKQQLWTIAPQKKVTVFVPMRTAANGKTDVRLRLLSESGKPIGVDRTIRVNATGFGRTAILITGGALVVLFLGVGTRVVRARRRNGAESRNDQGTGGGGAAPGERTADRAAPG
jgi:hypothetical protein